MLDRRRHARAAVLAAAALFLSALVLPAQQHAPMAEPFTEPDFVVAACPMWPGQARGMHVDCGYVSVPEDRGTLGGNVIRLAVVRLRGSVPTPNPDPVFYLADSPGESVLDSTHRLVDHARFIWEERDLILLDPRGIGHSEPRLECPDYLRERAELRALDLDPHEHLQREVEALLACKRSLSEQGIDMNAYTPESVAADVAEVAQAMGYETYNLYGSSFGSRLALTVMRDFPDDVRAVILDGVWPPQVNAAEARHANAAAAVQALFRRCEMDPDCAQRYPDLEQELWNVVRRYDENPSTFRRFDPDSSESFEVEVDGDFVLKRVLDSLRSDPWIPYVPFILHRMASGDRNTARAFIHAEHRFGRSQIDSSAAWASLLCHVDGHFADLSGVLADRTAHPRMVDSEAPDLVPALCAAWHDPNVEPVDRDPVTSDIPTLLLSGEFDPHTPPKWAHLAAETLTLSHSIVVPTAGHGVGMDTPCGLRLTGAFLDAPHADPSPACFAAADRKRSGFRTLFLYQPMGRWGWILWRPESTDATDSMRTPIVPRTALVMGVLFILLLHLSAFIVWTAGAAMRRVAATGTDGPTPRVGYPRVIAAAIIALSVGFWWSARAAIEALYAFMSLGLPRSVNRLLNSAVHAPDDLRWLTDEVARNFGYYSWVLPLFSIPYLTAAATVYVLYLSFRSWQKKWWTGVGRVHYSIVAITLAWYPFHLFSSGFLF